MESQVLDSVAISNELLRPTLVKRRNKRNIIIQALSEGEWKGFSSMETSKKRMYDNLCANLPDWGDNGLKQHHILITRTAVLTVTGQMVRN